MRLNLCLLLTKKWKWKLEIHTKILLYDEWTSEKNSEENILKNWFYFYTTKLWSFMEYYAPNYTTKAGNNCFIAQFLCHISCLSMAEDKYRSSSVCVRTHLVCIKSKVVKQLKFLHNTTHTTATNKDKNFIQQ